MSAVYFDPIIRYFWEGQCRDNWHEGPRRIYDCLLDYVSEGRYVVTIEGQARVQNAGDCVIVPPGVRNESALVDGRSVRRHCVHFSWNSDFTDRQPPLQTPAEQPFRTSLCHAVPPPIARRLPLFGHASGFLEQQLHALLHALRKNQEHAPLLLWPVLRALLMKDAAPAPRLRGASKAVLDLKNFIETHYFEEIGYREFCGLTRMSESYLCQIFQKLVGLPPAVYLNEIRLQHARRLLQEDRMTIKEVAFSVGVQDANYFARLFRKRFGVSPRDYRARV